MKFLKYLKFENIEKVFIGDIIGSEKTEKSVDALINLGIVKMNYNNPNYPSIQFHSLMKQEIENYIEENKKEQPMELFIDLLLSSIPNVVSIPRKQWKLADIYVPYVEYILTITDMETQQIYLLWEARYNYELNVRINYKNALEALKRSLEIQQSLTTQSETKLRIYFTIMVESTIAKMNMKKLWTSLQIKEKVFEDNHPSTADNLNNIG